MDAEKVPHEAYDDYIRAISQAWEERVKQAERVEEAYRSYVRAVREAWMEAQNRSVDAHRDYIQHAHERSVEADKRCAEAYRDYTLALIGSLGHEDALERSITAYYDHEGKLLAISADVQKGFLEANGKYAARLLESSLDSRKRLQDAASSYAATFYRSPTAELTKSASVS